MSDDTENLIIDDGDLRKYRIELPNLIDDLPLSPHAFRIYAHIKRRAGAAEHGYCFESTRAMAAACQMSTGMVSAAKAELVEFKLIKIERQPAADGKADIIRIVNIWVENFKHFAKPEIEATALPEKPPDPVHNMNTPRSDGEHPVHNMNTRINHDKNSDFRAKVKKRERAASPPAPLCPECKTPGQPRTTNEGPAVFCQTHGLKLISSGVIPKTAPKNVPDPLMHNPAVLEFKAVHGFAPERGLARETIAMRIENIPRWRMALRSWKLRGLNPKNIEGQIDWYDNGVPVHKSQPTAPQPRKAVIPG